MTYEKCPFCQNIYIASCFLGPGEDVPEDLKRLSTLTEEQHLRMYEINHNYREACGRCLIDGLKVAEAFGLA